MADVPVGILLAVAGIICFLRSVNEPDAGRALLTAAGLFGIGHGVHTAAKVKAASVIGDVGRSLAEQGPDPHENAKPADDPPELNQGLS